MNKVEMEQELSDLITRFKRLKKALQDEDNLTPVQRAIQTVVDQLKSKSSNNTNILSKAKEAVEQRQAQNLASQLQKAGILGTRPLPRQPTKEDQEAWLAKQGLGTSEEMAKAQEARWGNSINNWVAEATKPLNSRFKSKEEEQAYWDSIKISDGSRGTEGY
jgi:phage shock protein A